MASLSASHYWFYLLYSSRSSFLEEPTRSRNELPFDPPFSSKLPGCALLSRALPCRAETLARLSLFQKGHIRGRDSTRQLDRKRSLRQRLTSSSRWKQAEDSDGEDEEAKDGEDEAAAAGAGEAGLKVGEERREEAKRSEETGEGATDGPGKGGGAASRVLGLKAGLRMRSNQTDSGGRSEKGREFDDAKEEETSKKEADRKGKGKAEQPSTPAKSEFEGSRSGTEGGAELAQILETIAELCHVVEMDPESTIATVGLLLRDAVGLRASTSIRPLLGSMLALCERAQEGAGPLRALGNLVSVAQRKVALTSEGQLDTEERENGGPPSESGESEAVSASGKSGTGAKKPQAPKTSERTEGVSGAAKYRPRVGLRLEIDGTSQT